MGTFGKGKQSGLALLALMFAVSCSSPLDKVERLSEVEVAADAAPLDAPAMAAEPEPYVAGKGGLFSRVLAGKKARKAQDDGADAAWAEVVQDAPEGTDAGEPAPEAAPAEKRKGLFARLRRDKAETPEVETAPAPAAATAGAEAAPVVATMDSEAAASAAEAPEDPAADPAPRKGILGFLKKPKEPAPKGAPVEAASLAPVLPDAPAAPAAKPLSQPRKERGGLFARKPRQIDPNAPDAAQVAPGTVLPYGQIARMCDGNPKSMGKEVARYPERSPQYRLYDTAPGSSAAHTFLLTGFPDGCARQFTAALALFGGAEMHETLRYGLPAKKKPYSATDRAYEAIKSQVCKVGKNKPCGAKMSRLQKDTVFLSVYERFGDNARWADILLHEGTVVAQDMKSN